MGSGSFGALRKTLERDLLPRRLCFSSWIATQISPYRSLIDTTISHGTLPSQGFKPANPQVLLFSISGLVPTSMKLGLDSFVSVYSMKRIAAIGVEEIVKWPLLEVGQLMLFKPMSLLQVGERQMTPWEWFFMPESWSMLGAIGVGSIGLNAIELAPVWDRGWRSCGKLGGASFWKDMFWFRSKLGLDFLGLILGLGPISVLKQ